MRDIFFLLSLFFMLSLAMAKDVTLKLLESESYLRVGRISQVVLVTKDKNLASELKKNIHGVSLSDDLYLFSVEFIQDEDINNIVIGASVVLKQVPQSNLLNIKIDKSTYQLTLENVQFHPDDTQIKAQNHMFQENYNFRQFWFWLKNNLIVLISIVLLVLSILSIFIYKYTQKRKQKRENAAIHAFWLNSLRNAKTRKDLEQLYKQRHKWNTIFSGKHTDDFLQYINSIQYSPEWTEQELVSIVEKLDTMRKNIK